MQYRGKNGCFETNKVEIQRVFLNDCVSSGRPLAFSESYFPEIENETLKQHILESFARKIRNSLVPFSGYGRFSKYVHPCPSLKSSCASDIYARRGTSHPGCRSKVGTGKPGLVGTAGSPGRKRPPLQQCPAPPVLTELPGNFNPVSSKSTVPPRVPNFQVFKKGTFY